MIKKIFKVCAKTIFGVFLFYLITGFIILPALSWWLIPWQGSKILQTPVKLRSVFFNPLLLQVKANGFKVLDQQQQPILGFEQFVADVSFTNLFKKIVRIESIDLEGLIVNVAFLPDGQINLLTIAAPNPVSKPEDQRDSKTKDMAPEQQPVPESQSHKTADAKPHPLVIIDKINLRQGTVHFEDHTLQPIFSTTLSEITSEILSFSTEPGSQAKISFKSRLDEKGLISIDMIIKPLAKPLDLEISFGLNDYALQVLTPYIGKYTGRSLADGKLDVKMDYRIRNNQLTASHQLLIQHFEFGQKVESKDALSLPFGLAIALLEDPQGKIDISLPVTGDMSDPTFEYFHLVGQVVKNFFLKLVTKPFSVLASLVGGTDSGTDELGYVRFVPGKTGLPDEEKKKLGLLIEGLKQRPKLRLEINGSFDPDADWKAIQADMFTKDYDALRKESNRPEEEVYQLLYQRRFGVRALWDLAKKYKKRVGDYDHLMLNQEIKRQLIEDAPPDQNALEALAQTRAQLVHDVFLASGFDAQRLKLGQVRSVQSSLNHVPMELTLTFFDQQK